MPSSAHMSDTTRFKSEDAATPENVAFANIILQNAKKILGRSLPGINESGSEEDKAREMYEAPYPILAHKSYPNKGNIFVYGNRKALAQFETTWGELVGTPSTQSADPDTETQEDRNEALRKSAEKGYIENYQGWRRSFKGRRFRITNATLIALQSDDGTQIGHAAMLYGCTDYDA